ncbi:MAG TPA: hypothetical protein VFE23_20535 [Usitatibacter sp.]|jgi:hypothetical protein|nr:hypothetical protein [Usitatibacter sp.]
MTVGAGVARGLCAVAMAAATLGAPAARAYCVYNDLKDRNVSVEQETHPDPLRAEHRLRATLKPGQARCCRLHSLDCNPEGRQDSVVNLAIRIEGAPAYECGYPEGSEPDVKVTGGGTIHVLPNPRRHSAYPYIVRVRTHDRKDLTGPRGLSCPPAPEKGKQ